MAKKEMSAFEKAFAAARKEKGPNATFEFNGKKYTTARADDKPAPKGVARESDRPDYFPSGGGAKRGVKEGAAPTAGRGFRPDTDVDTLMGARKGLDLSRAGGKPAAGYYPMRRGGSVKKYAAGGSVGSASKRADGCAMKGKTKGRFV